MRSRALLREYRVGRLPMENTQKKGIQRVPAPCGPPIPPKAGRQLSVMAWVQNERGDVLMVRHARSNQLWTLPGGKVRTHEMLLHALRREVLEEVGVALGKVCLRAVYDRTARQTLTLLFQAELKPGKVTIVRPREIAEIAFKSRLPRKASPSAKFFWKLSGAGY